jgi:hypothetical protein
MVEIRSGVAVGDRLVVRGAERLEPGQAVTVATALRQGGEPS